MPAGKDGVWLRVGSMDGKCVWEGEDGVDKQRVWKSGLANVREKKSRPVEGCYFYGAKSGQPQHFPLGFEPCQVHALAKTCADLADITNAKQEAGLGTSSQTLSCFSWELGRRDPWSESVCTWQLSCFIQPGSTSFIYRSTAGRWWPSG